MRNPRQTGFTLLELMIVVAVIAILAMIAIPSYSEQIRKGKRAEAVQAIGDLQLRQERWRAEHAAYGTLAELSGTSLNSSLKNYTLSVNDPPIASGYTITATRKNDLANDPKCGNFTMTVAAGVATKGVSAGDVAYCWRQ
jgi:type IV pilus assembly protein PilE